MSEEDNKPNGDDEEGAKPTEHQNRPGNDSNDETLGDPGKRALESERTARRSAEKKVGELETQLNDLSKKLKKIEDDEAAELGKWEQLAGDRAARIEELEQDIAEQELTSRKADAIAKYKFSEDELALVHGETIEEYEASAKALAKLLSKNSGPDVSGGNTGGGNTGGKPSNNESDSKLKNWKFK